MFETETMAELCARQGLLDQAIDIFRRLAEVAGDPALRLRYETRISELGCDPSLQSLETPGLRVRQADGHVEIEWRLPPDLAAPTLQVLFLRRGSDGIQSDSRSLPLPTTQGRMTFPADGLASVRAAAGRQQDARFVPLVRFPDRLG
ncbi:MAG: hypothetical protein ACJ8F1_10170 [Polyangia bacterium]